jgi:hypothetical protein
VLKDQNNIEFELFQTVQGQPEITETHLLQTFFSRKEVMKRVCVQSFFVSLPNVYNGAQVISQSNASTTKNFESKKEVSAIIIITMIIHE